MFSPLIVLFMALMSSLTFLFFWARASSISISSSIQSFYLAGVGLAMTVGFLMEFVLPPFSFYRTFTVSFSLAASLAISLGGSLGCYYLSFFCWLALPAGFGIILLWEFLGYRICFISRLPPLGSSFLIFPALSILWTSFLGSKLFLGGSFLV